jgi:hypothetical protein
MISGAREDDLGEKISLHCPFNLVCGPRSDALCSRCPIDNFLLPVSAAPSRRGPTTDLSFILLVYFLTPQLVTFLTITLKIVTTSQASTEVVLKFENKYVMSY